MSKSYGFWLVSVFIVLVAACQQSLPTIDVSTDEALASSIAEVRASLPADLRSEIDGLIAERSFGGMLSSAFTKGTVSITAVMQPYDGMTGLEFITRAKAEQAEKFEKQKEEDLAQLAVLAQRQEAFEAEKQKLSKLAVDDVRLVHEESSFMSSANLLATITNNLSFPIAQISFDYSMKSPDRAVPWDQGEGWFFIDGGLESGEPRELDVSRPNSNCWKQILGHC